MAWIAALLSARLAWACPASVGPLGGCGDVTEHPAEYHAVERRYGSPVRVSGEPARLEDSPLAVGGHAVMVSADRHFEPGQAGQLHLRAQPQQRSWRDGLHPPEIQRVADEQVPRITPSAPQPDAAGEPVEQPAYCPCGREGVPPGLTTE